MNEPRSKMKAFISAYNENRNRIFFQRFDKHNRKEFTTEIDNFSEAENVS